MVYPIPSIILKTSVASYHSTHVGATAIIKDVISGPGTGKCTASNSEG
uniref:Uncharacterized protein n=1 Tax=Anopheles atroparvus TaxID=41427 RepID=A0AAG5D6T3_ANOAO